MGSMTPATARTPNAMPVFAAADGDRVAAAVEVVVNVAGDGCGCGCGCGGR